jgi:hypothetical protein
LTPDVTFGAALSVFVDPKGLNALKAGAAAVAGAGFSAFVSDAAAGLNAPGRLADETDAAPLGAAAGFLGSSGLNGLEFAGAFEAALVALGAGLSVSSEACGLNAPGRAVDETVAAPLGAAAGFLGSNGLNGLGMAGALEAASFLGAPMFAK